ncbi:lysophospholipase [Rhodotorula paludigena]|uniref:lysophospholipase n=1 Tax=Rhodotorula paludigena TaxID=86838 RepID=UPI003175F33C
METAAGPSLSNDLSVAWSLVSRLLVWTIHTALHLLTQTLAFATITLPTSVFNLVHYSVSLSFHLTFLKLLAFFLFVTTVASYVWKVRYLNRYTELRDLPGGNRIKGDEGFDLHPDLATDQAKNGFHNYLDEFLSAIKVFGYLEKPVFHELARHLQTRRLVAGDTLDLSKDKSFYIVVDGQVEVYARNPSSGPPGQNVSTEDYDTEDEEEGNGWQLLNNVESGGTLSSLFTILSLFTEDVKLRYEEDKGGHYDSSDDGFTGGRANESSRDEDVTALHLDQDGTPGRAPFIGLNEAPAHRISETEDADDEGAETTERERDHDGDDSGQLSSLDTMLSPSDSRSTSTTPGLRSPASDYGFSRPSPAPPSTNGTSVSANPTSPTLSATSRTSRRGSLAQPMLSRRSSTHRPSALPSRPSLTTRHPPYASSKSGTKRSARSARAGGGLVGAKHSEGAGAGMGGRAQEATIARAATDTTLAVIPAEAFRRLTKKFPNAAAHIVQVILTRLQRVTFLTAHKYLGLTREVIRTEQAINDLACYPLPPAFWESGGIQRLRARFVPETKLNGPDRERADGGEEQEDYFSTRRDEQPRRTPRGGVRAGSGSGSAAAFAGGRPRRSALPLETPYAGPRMGDVFWSNEEVSSHDEGVRLRMRKTANGSASGATAARRAGSTTVKDGPGPTLTRKAGDLLTMSTVTDEMRGLGSPVVQTPRLERIKSSGALSGATTADEFDLRDAVMECIAKAIGLVQPHVTPTPSAEASPLFRPTEHHPARPGSLRDQAVFNSSFGSLSFLGLQGLHDDESSVTSSALSALRGEGAHGGAVQSFASMDLENEVEILYFPKGSVLVKEGEKNAGLYFVIEGFLDVSMPEAESNMAAYGKAATKVEQHEDSAAKGSTTRPKAASRASQTSTFRSGAGVGATGPSTTRKSAPSNSPPPAPQKPKSIPLFTVRPGGIAGYLSSLSGFPSYVDIVAKTECYVGFLPAKSLERIMDRKPIVLLTLAKRLISLLSPLVLHIDSALDWMHVSAGQVIYRRDDPADSFYIVINGRLRSITEKQGGGVQVQAEFGQGESVGELDCITASPRPSTLHAIRDTELARMPMTLFNAISVRHPLVTIQISRIIAARLRSQVAREAKMASGLPMELGAPGMAEQGMGKNNFNLKTVAIIPTNRHVPVSDFASKLHQALEAIGAPTSYLNQATVMQVLGRHAFSRMGQLKLAGWLAETEQKYRIVLYVADTAVSAPWTQTCIRQADCIFVVADGGAEPELGEHEKLLVSMKTTARKELVLLHAERNIPPGTTRPWLKNRPWVHAHHHVEMVGATPEVDRSGLHDPAAVIALRKIAARVELQISKYKKVSPRPGPQRATAQSDFARLARRLCGKSIGIVLGGGGARGISHLGVLRALQERNIPIDMVGGTSIGAFVGGLYAREGDMVSTYGRAKRFSGRMSTLWRILTDLTYPVVAYTTGHEFNRGIYKSFYGTHIEDMWLPFFCNTTNITHSRMDVHTTGYAWRYVRASMSLAGLLPPLCDEGDMLVDGGYVDNLPVSVMLAQGAASVFAVDVGSVDDTSPRNYGESVSGWWLLLQRWNPFGKPSNIPNITEIQSRLTYVSSVKTLEEAKATPGVLYMRMPVTQFGTMDFKKFLDILRVGADFADSLLDEWKEQGKLPTGLEGDVSAAQKKQKRGQSIRRNSI